VHYGGPRSSAAAAAAAGVVFDQLTLIKVVNLRGTGAGCAAAQVLADEGSLPAGAGHGGRRGSSGRRGAGGYAEAGVGAEEGVAQGPHLRVPAQRRRQPQPCTHAVLPRGVAD